MTTSPLLAIRSPGAALPSSECLLGAFAATQPASLPNASVRFSSVPSRLSASLLLALVYLHQHPLQQPSPTPAPSSPADAARIHPAVVQSASSKSSPRPVPESSAPAATTAAGFVWGPDRRRRGGRGSRDGVFVRDRRRRGGSMGERRGHARVRVDGARVRGWGCGRRREILRSRSRDPEGRSEHAFDRL